MPREQFENGVHRIRPNEGVDSPTVNLPRKSGDQRMIYLTPSRAWGMDRARSFEMTNSQCAVMLKLSKAGGFAIDACTIFDRGTVKTVVNAIHKAGERGCELLKDQDNVEFADRLIRFLKGDGFNGFSISRSDFKRNRL